MSAQNATVQTRETTPNDLFRLDGRRAFVTGAATGIGQMIALRLARQGARVALGDIADMQATCDLIRAEGGEALPFALDVREVGQVRDVFVQATKALGGIDILVNNAGINRPMAGLDVDEANWEDHYRTNVKGGFFAAQAVAPGMVERGWGRIIFISSQSGLIGIPGQPVYCSTKGAIIQLVRTLGVEWARHGITVNSIAPTFIDTNLTHKRLQNPEFLNFVLGKIPCGKLAETDHIAAAAVYLASDQASMVNATTLSVDGGWTAW